MTGEAVSIYDERRSYRSALCTSSIPGFDVRYLKENNDNDEYSQIVSVFYELDLVFDARTTLMTELIDGSETLLHPSSSDRESAARCLRSAPRRHDLSMRPT